ncbi:hypothetical protein [Amycolatopsis sp. cmx-8-4]|uniref:hypothetical protein n=1 Tax=Amycolatopsis sp. cmx-8-4 TaxID=2790947 RepID=UPI0039785168
MVIPAVTSLALGWFLPASAIGTVVVIVVRRRRARRRPAEPGTDDVVAAITRPPPAPRPVAELSTGDLCTAWRRSYFQLLVARDAATRRSMVERRQDYLDELERRDRRGYVRWLHSGARAGGDPGPFLDTRR